MSSWPKPCRFIDVAPRQCASQEGKKSQGTLAAWRTNEHATKASIAKKSGCNWRTVGLCVARFNAGDVSMSDPHSLCWPLKVSAWQVRAATRHLTCAHRTTMHRAAEVAKQHCGEQGPVSEHTVRQWALYGKEELAKVREVHACKRKEETTPAKVRAARTKLHRLFFVEATNVRFLPGRAYQSFPRGEELELEGPPSQAAAQKLQALLILRRDHCDTGRHHTPQQARFLCLLALV
jgi:hypothetical protein